VIGNATQALIDPEGDLFLVNVSRVSKINKHTGTLQDLIIPNGLGYNFSTQNGGGGGGGPNDIGLNTNSIAFDKNDSIYLSGENDRVLSGSLRGGWKGGSDDFCSNANWDINVVPGPSMNVLIPTIPAGVQWPVVRCNTTVSNVRIKAGGILEIAQGYTLTADCITVEPGGSIIGKGTVSCSYVYIGQKLLGQRGWRVLSHPFTTNKLLQQNANINGITINTIPLYPANNTLDTRVFSNASNSWSNVTLDNIAANTNHALFIRGLVSDVTRMTYSNNPSATSYYVSGTLNPLSNNFTFPAPANANNFTLTGNPFPAPITSLALTGGVRRAYYVYVINQGATDLEKRTKAGGWSPVLLSSATTTIPALGVIQWKQPASSFTVSTSDLLPRGTAASSYMFGYESGIQNLELAVTQSGNIQDKLFVSVDSHSTDKGTDPTDLEKLTISGLNIYTIAVDKTHLAVDARSDLNTRIPLGINAENGTYNFVVNNNNLPAGTTVYLNDNFEHKIIDLTKKSKYSFSINSQAGSQGNNRFSLQILQNNSTAFFRNTFNIGLNNQSFEKGTNAF
jgi:hypothetical protein